MEFWIERILHSNNWVQILFFLFLSIILTLKLSCVSLFLKILARVDLPVPDKPVNQSILVINKALLNLLS